MLCRTRPYIISFVQVDELETALAEANKRLTRIDEADKRFATSPKPATQVLTPDGAAAKAEVKPHSDPAGPAKQ